MVFASLPFLYVFLPAALLLYFAMPKLKAKNYMLILLSLLFYAFGEPIWVALLVVSALTDYVNGLIIGSKPKGKRAKFALISSLVVNLGLLAAFKYLNLLFGTLGWLIGTEMPYSSLVMPIGISFYTFQTLSYTIDVYRGKADVQRSFTSFLLFVALFPQLIAGPILRYTELARQLENRRSTLKGAAEGFTRFLFGLGKKVLIANFAGSTADMILKADLNDASTLAVWIGITCYAFQIYFDFSGYSDMALGLGKIFGFEYGENFNYPYISRSITDFWRRWHISLGKFFRDYVYIPLGGNRKRQLLNIFIVWFLTGLWHGASWNFVLWGLYYGVLLAIEKFIIKPLFPKLSQRWFMIPVTFILTLLGWVFFYFTDLSKAFEAFRAMFGMGHALSDATAMIYLRNNIPLLIVAIIGATPLPKGISYVIREGSAKSLIGAALGLLLLLGATIALVGDSYNPFLYFRF
ncbi:alginate regulatory protein [Clostridia bacterium]|nr:alginate regulatory protein [Clostridia bacterium]